nr:SDR family oxidoreductase [Cryobacterium sp. Y50]
MTGGASGIGAATARRLAGAGYRVVVADLDLDGANRVAAEIGGFAAHVDVVNEQSVRALLGEVLERWGTPYALVTSAGVTQAPVPAEDLDLPEWQRVMTVNVQGTWLPAQIIGTAMAEEGRGAIATIASVAGMRSMPLHAYSTSKAAVIQLTSNLATQWGSRGVRVNGVAPGYTLTPLLESRIAEGERKIERILATNAMGRLVTADEVASTIEFLIGDAASAITGVTIPVDAGWLVTPSWSTYGELVELSHDHTNPLSKTNERTRQ